MKSIWRRAPSAMLLMLAALSSETPAQDALSRAVDTLGVDKIQSIEFEAAGTYYQFSQAPGPGLPWPAFDVTDYIATVDFARGAVHSRYKRLQKVEPDRVRPAPVEQVLDQYMIDGITWNVATNGTATAIPANLAERSAEIWTTPQGFVKAARQHSATIKQVENGNRELAFTLGRHRYEGLLNAAGEVLRVRTWMDSPVLGDTQIEWLFSQYRDFNGIRFPSRIERRAGNFPWYELTVNQVRINTAQSFSIPKEISKNPEPSVSQIHVSTLAPGVHYFTGGSHNSVIIEQSAGVVVIEAPLNEERSLAVIGKLRELVPIKPITHVINTHIHFDHAGGLRTYAHEGAIIVSAKPNISYLQAAWKAARTLNPDRLSQSKREPHFEAFEDKLVLPDSAHPIEVHEIRGNGHSDAFSMIFLPAEKILIEADAWTPAPAAPSPSPNPFWINLYENIERLGLDVERIAPLHGGLQTIDDLRVAIGKR